MPKVTRPRKPLFKVGQVVRVGVKSWGRIIERMPPPNLPSCSAEHFWMHRLEGNVIEYWNEANLRPLTAREVGPGWRRVRG